MPQNITAPGSTGSIDRLALGVSSPRGAEVEASAPTMLPFCFEAEASIVCGPPICFETE
jgi:hypothetical protein